MHSVTIGFGRAVRRFGPLLLRLVAAVTVLWFLVRLVGAAPFGVIFGARWFAAGRNTGASVTPVAAINMVY